MSKFKQIIIPVILSLNNGLAYAQIISANKYIEFTQPYIGFELISQKPDFFKSGLGSGYFNNKNFFAPSLIAGVAFYNKLGLEISYQPSTKRKQKLNLNQGSIMPGNFANLGALDGSLRLDQEFVSRFALQRLGAGLTFKHSMNDLIGVKFIIGMERVSLKASISNIHTNLFPSGSDYNAFDSRFSKAKFVPFVKVQGDCNLTEKLILQAGIKWSQTNKLRHIESDIFDRNKMLGDNMKARKQKLAMKDSYLILVGLRYEL